MGTPGRRRSNPLQADHTPLVPVKKGAGKWCEIHRTDRHDLTECRLVKGLAENHQKERGDRRRGYGPRLPGAAACRAHHFRQSKHPSIPEES
ncbi:hypothetical protein C2845_PM10G11850 [Panicum miliaceum]|uniref:Uncharacterized protein n=1 Tax=Panicum miliaceum TaxID=4540 RepID=A0A3L6PA93_PANMI|nr:hypothetical protein C2845_PM10G11850 [Panicum miliaceum]